MPFQISARKSIHPSAPLLAVKQRRRRRGVGSTTKPKALQCCYQSKANPSAQGEVSVVEDVKQACIDQDFIFSQDVQLDLRTSTKQALAILPGVKTLKELPLKWQQVIQGKELNITLCKEQDRDAYTVLSGAKEFAAGEPVLLMAGTYTEVDKWDRRVGDPNSHLHLWGYDMPADILQPGYGGPGEC